MSQSAPPPPPPENPSEPTGASVPPPPPPAAAPPPPPATGYGSAPGYGAAPPVYGSAGPQPANLLDRFLARLIDGIIVAIPYVIISVIIAAAVNSVIVSSIIDAVLISGLYLGYFAYLESNRGQTFGKQIMKLNVVGPDGASKPTMEQAVKRNLWGGLGILGIIPILGQIVGGLLELGAVILIVVTINNDTVTRRSWFDTFAGGTQVLKQG